ncbi:DsbA family protein [Candidatus Gottesmanbacteria bacterium]|nr:DsbA family protein [Candidatus Gottesmanbacteria bacterium]
MKITAETKLFIGIFISILAIFGVAFFLSSLPEPTVSKDELIPKATLSATGSATATTYLVEFSDFQCPACRAFSPIVDRIVKTNQDKIYFVYRHFPLLQHPFGKKAAQAAIAASKQGKFWEMHDFLFDNQDGLSDDLLNDAIQILGLGKEQFTKDFESNETQELISQDMLDGGRFGVNATPTFFLNGKKLNLAGPEELKSLVENEITK